MYNQRKSTKAPTNKKSNKELPLINKNLWTAVALQQKFAESFQYDIKPKSKQPESDDDLPQILTLAQQLGLEEKPPPSLTREQWQNVIARSQQRQDSTKPCAICREDFGLKPQVLLSCSHVFHEACLKSFEKFSKSRVCPICRHEQYQKKKITEGAKMHKEKCAIKIQSVWRGYKARVLYRKLLLSHPPMNSNGLKTFYAAKLEKFTDDLIDSIEAERAAFEQELEEMERKASKSKEFLKTLDFPQLRVKWAEVKMKALCREDVDCPICIMPLRIRELTVKHIKVKPVVLLSCSHLFHDQCIQSFEEFSVEHQPTCPVCRVCYEKKIL